jgi:3-mercaptopyruvate sulfurtransferase SseA
VLRGSTHFFSCAAQLTTTVIGGVGAVASTITSDQPVIAYCRIGERSSHTWFVLKYLLGFQNVKNYDGSWTEWGNLVGAAVEKP